MDKKTFDKFRKIIYEKSGISLNEGKESLVTARVGKRMRALGITDHQEYLRHVLNDTAAEEIVQLLDAISTNVTSFYRETEHFEFIGKLAREWAEKGQRRFRFWSAACSTGEEPYSLAITLLESLKDFEREELDIKILATDLSTRVLKMCEAGNYEKEKLASVSRPLVQRYFYSHKKEGQDYYTVKEELKKLITFTRLNLSEPPFPMRGPFDTVLCRNVMIYFDKEARSALLDEIHRLLKPDRYLLIGHSENLTGVKSGFQVIKPSMYIRK